MKGMKDIRVGSSGGTRAEPCVDILMSVYNGIPYVEEQIRSLQAQTHADWRLWVRDDGSTDETVRTLEGLATDDSRIRVLPADGKRLGAAGGFAYLLENAPPSAEYLMFCDADDVWRPGKIEATLEAMLTAESERGSRDERPPVLVHTDLAVVDGALELIAESFWDYEHIVPQPARLNRLLVHNSVTGCTVMINAALRHLAGQVPSAAVMHDWWLALVACCFGQIVSVTEATILYRQHGRNDTGARPYESPFTRIPSKLKGFSEKTDVVQASIRRTAVQAAAFLERFGEMLKPDQRQLISDFSGVPDCGPVARKYRLLRLGTFGSGWQRRARYILLG